MKLDFSLCLIILIFPVLNVGEEISSRFNPKTNLFDKQKHLIKSGFSSAFWDYVETNSDILLSGNVSEQCLFHLNGSTKSTFPRGSNILKFLSASGTRPVNFLRGTYASFGSYDSCLQISHIFDDGNRQSVAGKYCLASFEPDFNRPHQFMQEFTQLYPHQFDSSYNLSIKIGFCIPSTCSSDDFGQILSQVLEEYSWKLVGINQCDVDSSSYDRYRSANATQKVFLWLLVSLICIIGLGTLIDSKAQSLVDKIKFLIWIQQFSVFRSVRSLLRKPDSRPIITRLKEFRIITIAIVLFAHATLWIFTSNFIFLLEDYENFIQVSRKLHLQPLFNLWISEGLFLVGGFNAAVFLMVKMNPKTSVFSYLNIIYRRAASLVPIFLVLIAMEIVLPLFGSGPIFKSMSEYRSSICKDNFFYNIIHTHNLLDAKTICVLHTWSIAVDWQLFVFASILTYIYNKNNCSGLLLNIFLVIFGLYRLIDICVSKNVIPYIVKIGNDFKIKTAFDSANWTYFNTEAHIWSYFWGYLNIVIIAAKYESVIDKIRSKLFTLLKCLLVLVSFSSAPYNVFGWKVGPITTMIVVSFNQIVMLLWGSMSIIAHSNDLRRYLTLKKPIDRQIRFEKRDDAKRISRNEKEKFMTAADCTISSDTSKSWPQQEDEQCGLLRFMNAHESDIILRLLKSTYFIHGIVYTWYFSSMRSTIPMNFTTCIILLISLPSLAIVNGFFFYLLVFGPVERINYLLSKRRINQRSINQIHKNN